MRAIAKASLVAVFVGFGAAAAAAQPSAPPPATQVTSDNVILANYKKKHKKWMYSEKYGPRYRHRRHGFIYYHEGYWYPRRYWEPGISIHLGM